jgi:hypothetical protein
MWQYICFSYSENKLQTKCILLVHNSEFLQTISVICKVIIQTHGCTLFIVEAEVCKCSCLTSSPANRVSLHGATPESGDNTHSNPWA